MLKYVIDVNLPYYFSLWNSPEYIHVRDLDDTWTDEQIWEYAKSNSLTIVSKDADFSNRILFSNPPPKVIHIKFGNLKMKDFYTTINIVWNDAIILSEKYKLVNVFNNRIEGIE